jgi:hypothetical protein
VDTRTKILRSDQTDTLPADAVYVRGYFDPMLSAYADRLETFRNHGSQLVILLADPPDPLLPARSRAELAASLGAVDWVVLPAEDGSAAAAPTGSIQVHDETTIQLGQRADFVNHVLSRHGVA